MMNPQSRTGGRQRLGANSRPAAWQPAECRSPVGPLLSPWSGEHGDDPALVDGHEFCHEGLEVENILRAQLDAMLVKRCRYTTKAKSEPTSGAENSNMQSSGSAEQDRRTIIEKRVAQWLKF